MNWFYADGSQQKGPYSEAELQNFFNTGVIRAETLIWRQGMTDWQPYGKVIPQAGGASSTGSASPGEEVVCGECKQIFPKDDVIRYGDSYVCAKCKPVFVQKLKEGAALGGGMDYAGIWARFGAKFLDNIILQLAGFVTGLLIGMAFSDSEGAAFIFTNMGVAMATHVFYVTFFLGKFGATPGKMAAKIRVVNADGSDVSYGKAFGRCLAETLSGLILGIGYLMAAFDEEKRTLHDRICGTRVIKKNLN